VRDSEIRIPVLEVAEG